MYTAIAKKEIILSAGAIDTPRILLHSGIGPDEDLKKIGVNSYLYENKLTNKR